MRTNIRFFFMFVGVISLLLILPKYFAVTLSIANESDIAIIQSSLDVGGNVTQLGQVAAKTSKSVRLDPFEEGEVVVTVIDSTGTTSSNSFYLSALSVGERVCLVFNGQLKERDTKEMGPQDAAQKNE